MSLNPFAQIFSAKIIHPPLISKKKNKEKLKQITFLYINFISGPDPTPIGDRPQYKVFRRKGQVSIGGYLILLSSSEAEVSCILM